MFPFLVDTVPKSQGIRFDVDQGLGNVDKAALVLEEDLQGKKRLKGWPDAELERLSEERGRREPTVEEQIMEAMLLCCGEVGYRRLSVERVYRHFGGYRSQFYKHFRDKSDCFAAAYHQEANRVADRLVAFASEDGSREERLCRALETLGEFLGSRTAVARALFVEVHVAGHEAREKRREVIERLSRALDRACRETGSRHSPPPITAEFMISAIDQAVSSALLSGRPEEFSGAIPDLTALLCQAYGS